MKLQALSNFSPLELHEKLLESISYTKKGFIIIGKLLYELKNDNTFALAIGAGIDSWRDYLSQPEIGLTIGEASRLIQIYEEFVLRLGLSEDIVASIPIKNLHYLLPIAKQAQTVEDMGGLVGDAQTLSQKDFKERLYEVKHYEDERTYGYLVMKRCIETGVLSRVHDISSEMLKRTFNLP